MCTFSMRHVTKFLLCFSFIDHTLINVQNMLAFNSKYLFPIMKIIIIIARTTTVTRSILMFTVLQWLEYLQRRQGYPVTVLEEI